MKLKTLKIVFILFVAFCAKTNGIDFDLFKGFDKHETVAENANVLFV